MIIFVSSPYSIGDTVLNVRRACLAGDEILESGHIPYIPHLSHLWHLVSPKDYEVWLEIDLAILSFCDGVLRLAGESEGADREISEAKKLCIPVYYSVKEIPCR